jgi:hypothetical protein
VVKTSTTWTVHERSFVDGHGHPLAHSRPLASGADRGEGLLGRTTSRDRSERTGRAWVWTDAGGNGNGNGNGNGTERNAREIDGDRRSATRARCDDETGRWTRRSAGRGQGTERRGRDTRDFLVRARERAGVVQFAAPGLDRTEKARRTERNGVEWNGMEWNGMEDGVRGDDERVDGIDGIDEERM